jgi:signal transduction histidine kinase
VSVDAALSGSRAFLLLRYTLIAATAYLILVEREFVLPPILVMLAIVAALASNVVFAQLPEAVTARPAFTACVIVADTLWITGVLVYSGEFEVDFLYLYFFVLLLAAIGENLAVIALTTVVVCGAYLYVLTTNGTILSWWQSPSIIRLPFLFTTAAFYGYLIDRSRREQRRAREQAFAELERLVSQRTADLTATNHELSTFAYSVSHDLRAPLRAIDAFSQALLEDLDATLDAQGKDYLRRIRTNTGRMAQLIDDLLQLSRLTRTELYIDAIDLSAMAHGVAADLHRDEPQRDVRWEIQADLHTLGDRTLLQVLLENLLGNAWKYTGRRAAAHIAFGTTVADGETVYFVRDDGCGFDLAFVDKLFRPFQRLHTVDEYAGDGVGLATAQRVVRRHGGRIWVDAAPDRGATFYFTLGEHPELIRDTGQSVAA